MPQASGAPKRAAHPSEQRTSFFGENGKNQHLKISINNN